MFRPQSEARAYHHHANHAGVDLNRLQREARRFWKNGPWPFCSWSDFVWWKSFATAFRLYTSWKACDTVLCISAFSALAFLLCCASLTRTSSQSGFTVSNPNPHKINENHQILRSSRCKTQKLAAQSCCSLEICISKWSLWVSKAYRVYSHCKGYVRLSSHVGLRWAKDAKVLTMAVAEMLKLRIRDDGLRPKPSPAIQQFHDSRGGED